MAILWALLCGVLAGAAFGRATQRWRIAAGSGLLGAALAALVALAGDDPWLGAALGVGAAGLIARWARAAALDAARLAILALGALAALRLALVAGDGLPLAPDEAQYWDWSRSLDWAYYSKPGGIAWLIAGWTALFGDGLFALRALGLLLAALALAGAWALARTLALPPAPSAALAALLPIHALSAGLITTDVPLLVCWAWALALAVRWLQDPRPWQLPAFAVLVALGISAKYAMLYAWPALALALLAPPLRARRGWWAALALGSLLGVLPLVLWNAAQDWAGLRHLAGQASGSPGWWRPFEFVGGQLAVGLPVSVLLPWAVAWAWRTRAEQPARWLLASAALAPLAALALLSLQAKVQPNWAALTWVPAALLVAAWFRAQPRVWARAVLVGGLALAFCAAAAISALPALRARWPELPPSVPERKLAGWDELAAEGERELARAPAELLTGSYEIAAELAWHLRHRSRPYCANFGRRWHQYDLWQRDQTLPPGSEAVFVLELARTDELDGDWRTRLPAGLLADFAGHGHPRLLRVQRGERVWRQFLIVRLVGFDGALDSARGGQRW
ncbi:MAG: glycosyltransferase family 39 protein [Planctomycetota bacterium]|nr:glycosyltransferase family 39 protein [Planctomycetota bacterium]